MAKPKKNKSARPARPGPPPAPLARKLAAHLLIAALLIGGLAALFFRTRQYVEQKLVFPGEPPRVVLVNQPPWMSDVLAEQVAAAARPTGTHSAFDQQMLVDVSDMLSKDPRIAPWIKRVKQIRRAYGKQPGDTLEVDCDYRAPVALVHWGDYYWLVDGDGIKLPDPYDASQIGRIMRGRDDRMNIRVIEGVVRPPPESGYKWLGDDLMAGIELARVLYGKPYAEEIVKVNVANFGGRNDARAAQLVLVTRDGTEVQWGRPIHCKDAFVEVSPEQKLDYMERIVQKYRRVDGNHTAVDIRFDRVTFPADDGRAVEANGR